MHFSEGVTNDLALREAMNNFKNGKNIKDEIKNDQDKNGNQTVTVKMNGTTFIGQGKNRALAVADVTKKIQNHKPTLIKRKVDKLLKKFIFKRA